jgi:hypothetical protein
MALVGCGRGVSCRDAARGVSRKDAKGRRKDAKNCREYGGIATTKIKKVTKN